MTDILGCVERDKDNRTHSSRVGSYECKEGGYVAPNWWLIPPPTGARNLVLSLDGDLHQGHAFTRLFGTS